MFGDVHDELPDVDKGRRSTIRPMLFAHVGKWVELKEGVASSAASSYKTAKWVREVEEDGYSVEFAVRNSVLYGRVDHPSLF